MAKTSNQEYWEQVIVEQTNSELTHIKWCEQNNVNIYTFRVRADAEID